MKYSSHYWIRASFAFLIFVFIGYTVKFYPQHLVDFDSPVQAAIRGNLPSVLTSFFKGITIIGNPEVQIWLVLATVLVLFLLKWKAEAIWLTVNSVMAGLLIVSLKAVYERPRPSLSHLVEAGGYSFPSGHALGSMLILGTLLVIVTQRLKTGLLGRLLQFILASAIILVGLSRIYLGVHYPTDVLAGFILGFALLSLSYPTYCHKRFEWRFQSKQK